MNEQDQQRIDGVKQVLENTQRATDDMWEDAMDDDHDLYQIHNRNIDHAQYPDIAEWINKLEQQTSRREDEWEDCIDLVKDCANDKSRDTEIALGNAGILENRMDRTDKVHTFLGTNHLMPRQELVEYMETKALRDTHKEQHDILLAQSGLDLETYNNVNDEICTKALAEMGLNDDSDSNSSDNHNGNNNSIDSSAANNNRSLVEDFADPNGEMPSYMDPED